MPTSIATSIATTIATGIAPEIAPKMDWQCGPQLTTMLAQI